MSDTATPITAATLRAILSRQCEETGAKSAFARRHGLTVSQVSEAISGKRGMPDRIVNALGFFRVQRFVAVGRAGQRGEGM